MKLFTTYFKHKAVIRNSNANDSTERDHYIVDESNTIEKLNMKEEIRHALKLNQSTD